MTQRVGGKLQSSIGDAGSEIYMKKLKLGFYFTSCAEIISKWRIKINVNDKTRKVIRKQLGRISSCYLNRKIY